MIVYHLVWQSDWNTCRDGKYYRPASLDCEGFVHATRELDWVLRVANQLFPARGDDELLLIALQESLVGVPVRDEDPGVGHRFPHIFGPINLAAVAGIGAMQRGELGWLLPNNIVGGGP